MKIECPVCNSVFHLTSEDSEIKCNSCNSYFDIELEVNSNTNLCRECNLVEVPQLALYCSQCGKLHIEKRAVSSLFLTVKFISVLFVSALAPVLLFTSLSSVRTSMEETPHDIVENSIESRKQAVMNSGFLEFHNEDLIPEKLAEFPKAANLPWELPPKTYINKFVVTKDGRAIYSFGKETWVDGVKLPYYIELFNKAGHYAVIKKTKGSRKLYLNGSLLSSSEKGWFYCNSLSLKGDLFYSYKNKNNKIENYFINDKPLDENLTYPRDVYWVNDKLFSRFNQNVIYFDDKLFRSDKELKSNILIMPDSIDTPHTKIHNEYPQKVAFCVQKQNKVDLYVNEKRYFSHEGKPSGLNINYWNEDNDYLVLSNNRNKFIHYDNALLGPYKNISMSFGHIIVETDGQKVFIVNGKEYKPYIKLKELFAYTKNDPLKYTSLKISENQKHFAFTIFTKDKVYFYVDGKLIIPVEDERLSYLFKDGGEIISEKIDFSFYDNKPVYLYTYKYSNKGKNFTKSVVVYEDKVLEGEFSLTKYGKDQNQCVFVKSTIDGKEIYTPEGVVFVEKGKKFSVLGGHVITSEGWGKYTLKLEGQKSEPFYNSYKNTIQKGDKLAFIASVGREYRLFNNTKMIKYDLPKYTKLNFITGTQIVCCHGSHKVNNKTVYFTIIEDQVLEYDQWLYGPVIENQKVVLFYKKDNKIFKKYIKVDEKLLNL